MSMNISDKDFQQVIAEIKQGPTNIAFSEALIFGCKWLKEHEGNFAFSLSDERLKSLKDALAPYLLK